MFPSLFPICMARFDWLRERCKLNKTMGKWRWEMIFRNVQTIQRVGAGDWGLGVAGGKIFMTAAAVGGRGREVGRCVWKSGQCVGTAVTVVWI